MIGWTSRQDAWPQGLFRPGTNQDVDRTVINSLFPGLATFYALYYWHRPKPGFVLNYWIIYCAVTVMGAITAWWIPYFYGTDEKTNKFYEKMYAGTRLVMPPRGNNPQPNLLHLYFRALFLSTLVLSAVLWFRIVQGDMIPGELSTLEK
jgi:hypothetical protein